MDKIFYSLGLRINHYRPIHIRILFFALLCLMFQLKPAAQQREAQLRPYVKKAVFALSNVMMHDVVSPVIASRYYMYCTIGATAILSKIGRAHV